MSLSVLWSGGTLPVISASFLTPSGESASRSYGYFAPISRLRGSGSATRLGSVVIHRRPHCSATYAVVPEPQVGSKTRSPGSVVIRRQRATELVDVWTT